MVHLQQIELFPFEELSPAERKDLLGQIRNAYWSLRNLRGGRFGRQHGVPIRLPNAEVHRMRESLYEAILHNINYTNL
ncbi:hypothetical protein D3C81_1418620 [compost metagenome]